MNIKCNACGCEGIHACLGAQVKQEDLPEGVTLVESGELMKRMDAELNKYDIDKLSICPAIAPIILKQD